MRKPTIDELLSHEGSLYTLTMLVAKRARQLKILDREIKLPLQEALDEVANGTVTAKFLERDIDDEKLVEGLKKAERAEPEEPMMPSAFDDEEEVQVQQPTLFPET